MSDNCEHAWPKANAFPCPRCADAKKIRALEAELAGLRAINQKGGHGIRCPQLLARTEKAEAELARYRTLVGTCKPRIGKLSWPGWCDTHDQDFLACARLFEAERDALKTRVAAFALTAWDDRVRWSNYIQKLIDEITGGGRESGGPIPKDGRRA